LEIVQFVFGIKNEKQIECFLYNEVEHLIIIPQQQKQMSKQQQQQHMITSAEKQEFQKKIEELEEQIFTDITILRVYREKQSRNALGEGEDEMMEILEQEFNSKKKEERSKWNYCSKNRKFHCDWW